MKNAKSVTIWIVVLGILIVPGVYLRHLDQIESVHYVGKNQSGTVFTRRSGTRQGMQYLSRNLSASLNLTHVNGGDRYFVDSGLSVNDGGNRYSVDLCERMVIFTVGQMLSWLNDSSEQNNDENRRDHARYAISVFESSIALVEGRSVQSELEADCDVPIHHASLNPTLRAIFHSVAFLNELYRSVDGIQELSHLRASIVRTLDTLNSELVEAGGDLHRAMHIVMPPDILAKLKAAGMNDLPF